MRAYERLIRYAKIDTQSDEAGEGVPSTAKQAELARVLKAEMERLGMERTELTENAYVYGFIPASAGCEGEPKIGLIAHLDTAPDFSGTCVNPSLIENYDGRDIVLGTSGRVIEAAKFPELPTLRGQTLIVTDGTTLLGADDKAGVAEIMTACEKLMTNAAPHCAVSVCFTPDEEIGHGAQLLDLEKFNADFAFTLDGDAVNDINYETFNAASACFDIAGVNVHPGSAKGIMVNAALIACEINAQLPPEQIPAKTEGYEGFYHLTDMSGSVERAQLKYIVRDHDAEKFAARCELMSRLAQSTNERYGAGTVTLTLKNQYRNMAERLRGRPEIIQRAENAIRKAGLEPTQTPIRGGTDGSQLTFRGLPCPNLGTGGYGFHGPYEHISIEAMDKAVEIIINIVSAKL